MVPSHSRKAMSGQRNNLGMVTSHKMMETEMDNRGSNSEIIIPQPKQISVKEQRVDGSWSISSKLMLLRCTLTGFESDYPVKFPSKQLNNRSFSNLNLQPSSKMGDRSMVYYWIYRC